jgi:DNA-binding HxlR family transcriptional regulator
VDGVSRPAGHRGSAVAAPRYGGQYCPIARALGVLGDRWTLLVVRELMAGEKRFTDLHRSLPPISPAVLTQRLREMAAEGLVETRDLPEPAARTVYTLTERGREAVPVLRALARFGMPLLDDPPDDLAMRPAGIINIALRLYYDAAAAAGVDERYLLRADGEEHILVSARGPAAPAGECDLVLESAARLWLEIRRGALTLEQALEQGLLQADGSPAALANFRRVFQVS